jgi:hypothetical protein
MRWTQRQQISYTHSISFLGPISGYIYALNELDNGPPLIIFFQMK